VGRENKKKEIADLNRKLILDAAGKLFVERGFEATKIDDISESSGFSRRTIYAYFKNKETIMQHIVFSGLDELRSQISLIMETHEDFLKRYDAVCHAMVDYLINKPNSSSSVNSFKPHEMDFEKIPDIIKKIFQVGDEIHQLLVDFVRQGKREGIVLSSVDPEKTVFIMWSEMTALIELVRNKGLFINARFQTTTEEFLKYGFNQIINSILEVRI